MLCYTRYHFEHFAFFCYLSHDAQIFRIVRGVNSLKTFSVDQYYRSTVAISKIADSKRILNANNRCSFMTENGVITQPSSIKSPRSCRLTGWSPSGSESLSRFSRRRFLGRFLGVGVRFSMAFSSSVVRYRVRLFSNQQLQKMGRLSLILVSPKVPPHCTLISSLPVETSNQRRCLNMDNPGKLCHHRESVGSFSAEKRAHIRKQVSVTSHVLTKSQSN